MKILVTGANGFIGSHLVEFLYKEGHAIRCFVHRNQPPHFLEKSDQLEWCPGDLKDVTSLEKAVEGCDMVIHAAAISRFKADLPDQEYRQVNVEGTRFLLEAALKHKLKKFIFISSIEAVGLSQNGEPLIEESLPCPRNIYGQSKLEAEGLVKSFYTQRGLQTVTIRIGTTYGPKETMVFRRYFLPISKGFYPIFGDGSALMEFSYVKNQVQGIWRAAEKGRPGEIYFLSDARPYSFKEVVKEIGTQLGVRLHLIFLPIPMAWIAAVACEFLSHIFPFYPFHIKETNLPPFSRRTLRWATKSAIYCSTAKAKRELDYIPSYSLSEGLRETTLWYKEKGWLK